MSRPLAIFLVGPTAIGKTATAIRLAKALKTEIISADSRQFFTEMSIGTAKPSELERAEVKHHFIDFISIKKTYSAGDFERDALHFLHEFFRTNDRVVITGGSGLYLNAIAHGFDELPADPEMRRSLIERFEQNGLSELQEDLEKRDPEIAGIIDMQNPQRVIRALEVCLLSDIPYSALRQDAQHQRTFDAIWVGLTADREVLYHRINQRVDGMIEDGLIEEAKSLYPHRSLNALNTVGYKELFSHFDGASSQEEAIEAIKKNTRNFAKRQMTWFRKNQEIHWFDYKETDQLIDFVREQCHQKQGS